MFTPQTILVTFVSLLEDLGCFGQNPAQKPGIKPGKSWLLRAKEPAFDKKIAGFCMRYPALKPAIANRALCLLRMLRLLAPLVGCTTQEQRVA